MTAPFVLHETDDWFVLEKPVGCHTVAREDDAPDASVESWLRSQRPELDALEECGLVHRLDHGTGGCLLVARSEREQERLREGMRDGSIRKIYQALAATDLPDEGRFELHFTSRYKRSRKVTVSEAGEQRHRGVCTWAVSGTHAGRVLLDIELHGPGRRHQIRAGFANLGAPLLGDALYGGPSWEQPHVALHAMCLHLDGVTVESASPLVSALTCAGG